MGLVVCLLKTNKSNEYCGKISTLSRDPFLLEEFKKSHPNAILRQLVEGN